MDAPAASERTFRAIREYPGGRDARIVALLGALLAFASLTGAIPTSGPIPPLPPVFGGLLGLFMMGMGIWAHFLNQDYERDFVQTNSEGIRDRTQERPLRWEELEDFLADRRSSQLFDCHARVVRWFQGSLDDPVGLLDSILAQLAAHPANADAAPFRRKLLADLEEARRRVQARAHSAPT